MEEGEGQEKGPLSFPTLLESRSITQLRVLGRLFDIPFEQYNEYWKYLNVYFCFALRMTRN